MKGATTIGWNVPGNSGDKRLIQNRCLTTNFSLVSYIEYIFAKENFSEETTQNCKYNFKKYDCDSRNSVHKMTLNWLKCKKKHDHIFLTSRTIINLDRLQSR